jgi:DNA-binding NarL/FixJ family response regulator
VKLLCVKSFTQTSANRGEVAPTDVPVNVVRPVGRSFTAMGVEGFAERARCELVATGETVRRRTVEIELDLTAQEAHIAPLARERLTNPEIAARLFLSPRTVEWHLHKVFTKLGITSRRQLDEALRRREKLNRR